MTECKECIKHKNFALSQFGYCPKCRILMYGKGNRKCRLCNKIGPQKEFNGNMHSRCRYLRDKRLANGGVLVTITKEGRIE